MDKFTIGTVTAILVVAVSMYSLGFAQGSVELQLLGHLNEYPGSGYSDCWGYTAPDGHEYALLGVDAGVSIVDITDTSNIAEVDFVPFVNYSWYDIKTYQNYMYVTSEGGNNLLVVDLSPLPAPTSVVGQFPVFSSGPHNNFIDTETGILYGVEDQHYDPSLRIIDIASPGNPMELSTINTANNGTDSHDIFAQDSVLYIAEGFNPTIGFFDVSDPTNPSLIQRLNIPAAGYVHQVWVSKDNKYMITTEETSGKTVKMWNIQDINNISLLGQYLGGSQLAHNAYLKRDYAYISHYESGLKVVDISDPNNIVEVGYYDTYPQSENPNYNGAWGTYPFFSSGKILISDIQTGLYVVYFQGAADADALDPNSPENFAAYSDYSNPNSMQLSWQDPTTYFGGDPLSPSDFTIEIERDQVSIASVAGGTETYTDNGLTDGTLYEYTIYAKIISTDSTSLTTSASWIAGGSPIPKSPSGFFVTQSGNDLLMHWTNPTQNVDNTPMDDFAGVKLYEDGIFKLNLARTSADTGKSDSVMYTPPTGTHQYYVTTFDSENPSNESDPSNGGYSPLAIPFFDDFPSTPTPNSSYWITSNAEVTANGVNPPSAPNVLQLDAHPSGGDMVSLLPVDLSNAMGTGMTLEYWYQPAGTGNDPEPGDALTLEFLNDQGSWITIRSYPGTPVVPFVNEAILIENENPGAGATFFHPAFQFRFRSSGTASTTEHYDLWLIDDVSLEPTIPTAIENSDQLPAVFALWENYPNPFNPSTTIGYQVPRQSDVRIEIYNILGQEVRLLLNDRMDPGVHKEVWDGRNDSGEKVSSGIYIYRMVAGDFIQVRKMILMK